MSEINERPRVEWTRRVHAISNETLEIVIDRLDLHGRPKYSYQIKQLRDNANSLPFISRDVFCVDAGAVIALGLNAQRVAMLIDQAEAWICTDAQLRTHAPRSTNGTRNIGKTARDRAKHKDDSRRTNNT